MQRTSSVPPSMEAASTGRKRLPRVAALCGLAALGLAASPVVTPLPQALAAALFDARPVDPGRFAVLGRPLRNGDWSLVVLEQIQPDGPPCWRSRADGLVDPSLNRFDFTGICGRYVDSNGFSLRLGGVDAGESAAGGLHLRLQQTGSELQLQASSPELNQVVVVGRATVPRLDRNAFVALRLDPGWELQRRLYGGQSLNHIYLANGARLETLLAATGASRTAAEAPLSGTPAPRRARLRLSQLPPPPPPPAIQRLPQEIGPGRAIALQVIPFQE